MAVGEDGNRHDELPGTERKPGKEPNKTKERLAKVVTGNKRLRAGIAAFAQAVNVPEQGTAGSAETPF
ncbi:hypothetical protein [Streptomyces glaucosporus]|uniref:hypothetical protein n=1 Tax=Streptomyces glaucosporus TaxID=284044 RepID=UPI0031DA7577